MILYVQTQGSHSTNSGNFTPIPGLSLTLPEGVKDTALVVLNVPNPYATGNANPGGTFAISVGGVVQTPIASFTYNEVVPPSSGRVPTTLVVGSRWPARRSRCWRCGRTCAAAPSSSTARHR
jgi:hypothetical protein